MPTVKKRSDTKPKVDIEIRQDPDLRSAFDFWVRSIYLNRPSTPQVTSCESLSGGDDHEPPKSDA